MVSNFYVVIAGVEKILRQGNYVNCIISKQHHNILALLAQNPCALFLD